MTNNADTKCPRCDVVLQPEVAPFGTVWKCNGCGGRGVGLAVLRVVFTPESINPLWLNAIDAGGGGGQAGCACPSCRNPMIEVPLSDNSRVQVDVCRLCQFVWLDINESVELIPRSAKDQQQALSEAFGARGGPAREQLIREMDAKTSAERWRAIPIALYFS
jgi:Zn-finger nucleic acid-binding protein